MSRWEPRYLGVGVALVSGAVYTLSASRWVVGGDNGEFATLYANGGVAHPPGYPLYIMTLRAFAWLPVASPAHGAALVTAAIGALGVFLLFGACRAWGASEAGAAVASAVYASSSLSWRLNTEAEVFGLNVLIACAILVAAAPSATATGWRRAGQLGLLAGLGLSNHHSIVLLAPLGLWAFARAVREEEQRRWTVVLAAALGLALGLAPYGYLYWCARTCDPSVAWVWGDIHDLRSLVDHFRRAEYGMTRLALADAPLEPGAQVWHLGLRLTSDLLGLPILAIAFGVANIRKARAGTIALTSAVLLSGPGFVAIFNMPPRGLAALVVERFYLLPSALACVPGAIAVDHVARRVLARPGVASAIAGMAMVAGFMLALAPVREGHRPTVEMYVKNTLRFAPPDVVILASGDQKFAGLLYGQRVLHLRPDVAVVAPSMLSAPWYRERVARSLGARLDAESTGDPARLVDALSGAGRPVAFAGPVPSAVIAAGFVDLPLGTLALVQPARAKAPSLDDLEADNVKLLGRFELEPVASTTKASWAASTFGEYARTWIVLAQRFERSGAPSRAKACRERAVAFAPWLTTD